jgi:hypothetical protein
MVIILSPPRDQARLDYCYVPKTPPKDRLARQSFAPSERMSLVMPL